MPITGSQLAPTYARLGVARLGATRLGYYQPIVYITINGTDRRSATRVEGLTIRDYLDGQPNIATMRVSGFTPTKGHEVKIGLGSISANQLIFAGHIQAVTQVYEGIAANVAFDLTCISYEWLLNRRKVTKRWVSTSATTIAQEIISGFTSGFTSTAVASGLATIDEFTCENDDVTDALDRLAKRVGGYWYIDTARDLHLFTSAEGSVHSLTGFTAATIHSARGLAVTTDLDPVRTRLYVEGGGASVLVPIAVGDSTIPVEDAAWFSASGGTVVSGPQRITYTGRELGGTGSAVDGVQQSPSAPSAAANTSADGGLGTGSAYAYKASFAGASGQSELSSASGGVTLSAVSAPGAPTAALASPKVSGNLLVGTSYLYKVTFVTSGGGETAGGTASGSITPAAVDPPSTGASASGTTGGSMTPSGQYRYQTTFVTATGETTRDTHAGGYDVTLTALQNAVSLTSIPVSSDGRVTKRRIYRIAAGEAGWDYQFQLITTINDNSTTTYTDTTSDAGRGAGMPTVNTATDGEKGALTSIPTSADGRVTKRRIYRSDDGGTSYKLVTQINDNSTTTHTDNAVDGSTPLPDASTATTGAISVSSIPVGPSGTTKRRLWRTTVGGSVYRYLGVLNDNSTTTFADTVADEDLGEEAPSNSTWAHPAASTTLRVLDLAQFPASGWARVGSQVLLYTGRAASSGAGNLTGIPASGTGSIAAAIQAQASAVAAPYLSGVTGVLYVVAAGEAVNLLVTRNDATAQTAMAGFVGGDGIHEEYVRASGLTQTECEDLGDAKLAELKDPIVTARYQTRDQTTRSGREVTISLGAPTSVSGTFKIQAVTLTAFDPAGRRWPIRDVTASSRRESFESLLRLVKKQVA